MILDLATLTAWPLSTPRGWRPCGYRCSAAAHAAGGAQRLARAGAGAAGAAGARTLAAARSSLILLTASSSSRRPWTLGGRLPQLGLGE